VSSYPQTSARAKVYNLEASVGTQVRRFLRGEGPIRINPCSVNQRKSASNNKSV